ncbi:hypothetical protein D7027_05625 [Ochrobactrum intermedium]|uniref:hypothetical protein n=1 Tax=Brucella intermedia TaxID=94625 RepID=UPI00128C1B82|nr:hypothetical protein [Brucella intermedia]MPR61295.1 hypothetical protein [Brucella intermedia]
MSSQNTFFPKTTGTRFRRSTKPAKISHGSTDTVSHQDISAAIRDLQPIRRGDEIFITLNGEEVKLSPMQAQLMMRAWVEAVGGAFVAIDTKYRD